VLDEPEQAAVVNGLRAGDRTAWSTLYNAYSADVWRYVARLVGPDTTGVADVVQETFLAAARSARQFDPSRGSLWGWLTGIAHHQVSLHWRGAARVQRLKSLLATEGAALNRWLTVMESVEESWSRQELADAVRKILADLPADYAALLTGKYLDDRTLEELACDLGSSSEGVKSKLARARREFRALMETWLRREGLLPQTPERHSPESVSETGRP